MEQQQALNDVILDVAKLGRRKNRQLTIVLMVSLLFNMVLACTLFDVKTDTTQSIGDTVVIGAMVAKKPSEHIVTRQKLRDIAEVKTFDDLLNRCVMTDEERQLMREHYLNGKSFVAISMDMGYSEDWVKQRHRKVLKKIQKLL